MNDRIKEVRKALDLSQEEFGKRLGVSRGVIVNMELNRAEIKPLFIEHLCSMFSINKHWLETGRGQMFIETEETIISSLATEYDLDSLDRKIIECYINMQAPQRMAIKSYLRSLFDTMLDDDTYSDYRDQYINESAGQAAARDGNSENLGEIKELFDNK